MKSINELFWNEDQNIFGNDNQLNNMGDCVSDSCTTSPDPGGGGGGDQHIDW